MFGSRKLRRLLPYLFAHARRHLPADTWNKGGELDDLEFAIGDALLVTGRPYVSVKELESTEYSCLLIAPYLTGRGPNGIWTIQRGTEHPLLRMFAGACAYHLSVNGEQVRTTYHIDDNPSGTAIDLFRQPRDAKSVMFDDEKIAFASETPAVLKLLHRVDLVISHKQDFALTPHGRRMLGEETSEFRSDAAALAKYLKTTKRPTPRIRRPRSIVSNSR
jgi:hypothetical protein